MGGPLNIAEISGMLGTVASVCGFLPLVIQAFTQPEKYINMGMLAIFVVSDILWIVNGFASEDWSLAFAMVIQLILVVFIIVRVVLHKSKKRA